MTAEELQTVAELPAYITPVFTGLSAVTAVQYRVSPPQIAMVCSDLRYESESLECLRFKVKTPIASVLLSSFGSSRSQVRILSPRFTAQ